MSVRTCGFKSHPRHHIINLAHMSLEKAIDEAPEQPAAYAVKGTGEQWLYKGSCRNLKKRLKDHRAGRVSRTKNRRPLSLAWYKIFGSYAEARRKEIYLKTGKGREWLKGQILP